MTKEQFKQLYDTYFDALRNYVYYRSGGLHFASDIAQEVFIKCWEKKIDFDLSKNKSLLYKMANDKIIDKWRYEKVREQYKVELLFKLTPSETQDNLAYKELKGKYEKALSELNDKQRTTFLMSRYENLPYKEIADRLNISIKTVEKRISETLKILRQEIKPNDATK